MASGYTAQETRDMGQAYIDAGQADEILLAKVWNREGFNKIMESELTVEEWADFVKYYTKNTGLEDVHGGV